MAALVEHLRLMAPETWVSKAILRILEPSLPEAVVAAVVILLQETTCHVRTQHVMGKVELLVAAEVDQLTITVHTTGELVELVRQ